jgi:hypothetical protein
MPQGGVLNVGDFQVEVSRGIAGYSHINKFGKNADIDQATDPEDIWDKGGLWVAPTAARLHALVSTSGNDKGTPAAGTGARTVEVQGLNEDWDYTTETVILDGVTPVNTDNTYWRIFRMIVLTAGSGGVNAGTITATAAVDTTITAQINIGNNQTMMAIYTVPNERTGHMNSFYASVLAATPAGTQVTFQLWARDAENAGAWQLKHEVALVSDATSYANHPFRPAKKFQSKWDIRLTVGEVTADNASVTGGFDIVTIDE